MSDWGGTHSTVKAALAGFDQEEPGGQYFGDALKAAVEKGEVPKARLDDMVHRVLRTEYAFGVVDNPPVARPVNCNLHLARIPKQITNLLLAKPRRA
jgi:beta-glucosidase